MRALASAWTPHLHLVAHEALKAVEILTLEHIQLLFDFRESLDFGLPRLPRLLIRSLGLLHLSSGRHLF